MLAGACSDPVTPAAPTPSTSSAGRQYPPLFGPARIFEFAEAPLPPAPWTQESRYVLYDSGTFALQYAGRGEYGGSYAEESGVVTFTWDGWSAAGPWGATGYLSGDALTVRYTLIMQLTDFEDAEYVRSH